MIAGTLVGSLQLARALGDNAEGRAVLSAARKALIQQHDTAAANGRLTPSSTMRTPQRLARSPMNMTIVIFIDSLQPPDRNPP